MAPLSANGQPRFRRFQHRRDAIDLPGYSSLCAENRRQFGRMPILVRRASFPRIRKERILTFAIARHPGLPILWHWTKFDASVKINLLGLLIFRNRFKLGWGGLGGELRGDFMSNQRLRPGDRARNGRRKTASETNLAALPNLQFDWTNDGWAKAHLPTIRIAALFCAHDSRWADEKLEALRRIDDSIDPVKHLLDDLALVRDHFISVLSLIEAAEARITTSSARLPSLFPEKARGSI